MPFYTLGMFPYPSGRPHMGHVRVYTLSDVRARHARLHGEDVLHPMGWDAFGLPAENAAVARGVDPAEWTAENIAQMRAIFARLGFSFDADREISTADPAYYRWTQWLFLQLFQHGLAYEADGWVHWCPACATVLADEQVVGGTCWRCDADVERRQRRQWMFRITAYAQALWDGLDALTGWDPRAVAVQRNWIRRSEGAWAAFGGVEVFSTRIDTLGGVVAVVVAPEHPLARASGDPDVQAYVTHALSRSAVQRMAERAPSGVPLGVDVPHPISGAPIPVWVGDYVIGDYGTGAVMCVPAHDERDAAFADAVGLPVGSGELRDAGAVVDALEARGTGGRRISWNLRDWSVGRQRSWGCPIPMVRCEACGAVPVPDAELPVLRESPVERPCPRCGGAASRETDTLDTFVDSSWYQLRFCDPHATHAPFDKAVAARWMPVDVYVGGLDHAAQHMLYTRFVTRFLFDRGVSPVVEPVAGFVCNGMVLGDDGRKMSKSSGNGRDPVGILETYGADALRLAVLADSPVERDVAWSDARVEAKARFLERFAGAVDRYLEAGADMAGPDAGIGACIAAIDDAIRTGALHVAVARIHELARALRPLLERRAPGAGASLRDALKAMYPFVPGWVEARWPAWWGAIEGWPAVVSAKAATAEIVVQVDGRTTGSIAVPAGTGRERIRELAEAAASRRLEGRAVARVVVVEGRLVNLVTA
ncbi:MAG: class I tRNA ligase family protein [Alphaproteobacteria bacterium]|nr:class I tRNA ligase family protein [Alphaproteobacteria bacterium]